MNKETAELRKAVRVMSDFYHRENELYQNVARKIGLSDSAFAILYDLHEQDGLTQKQLAVGNCLSKQTINSSVKRLEENGQVCIETHGRTSRIWLTDAGHQLAKERIEPVVQAECAALDHLPPKERHYLLNSYRAYLEALATALNEL